ncbi:hypothetical protein PGC35_20200 [Psychrobacillus sp. PGGUH221]|uniref:hypothetical protein n=1 Tax=Psychrobacillus sp. PGGUH221 TaxID=3020058 RepID=UPI0035C68935
MIGHFPSTNDLIKIKENGIISAIHQHGGLSAIYKEMNVTVKRMRWETLEDVVNVYKNLYDELGRMPTFHDLKARNLQSIRNMVKKFGGIQTIYKKLCIVPTIKPYGYWNDIENVIKELRKIEEEIKHFPSSDELKKMGGNTSLITAIQKKHGGYNKVRDFFSEPSKHVPPAYYSDFENVLAVIEICTQKVGHFPTIVELESFRPGIKFGILKYHEGYKKVRNLLNQKHLSVPPGYWKNFDNIRNEIELLIDKLGGFPTIKDMNRYGPPGLSTAIAVHVGGVTILREKLGIPPRFKSQFEKRIKSILDAYVEDITSIDNRKKQLNNDFGINLIHPITKNYMELDRYYPDFKVACEVQGTQHNEEVEFFAKQKGLSAKDYLEQIRLVDKSKKEQCEAQGIQLIYFYDWMTVEDIISVVEGFLPLRKVPSKIEIFPELRDTKEEILIVLKALENETEELKAKDIKNFSRPFYERMLSIFGTTANAIKAVRLK